MLFIYKTGSTGVLWWNMNQLTARVGVWERIYEPLLPLLNVTYYFSELGPACGHPGLPEGGELQSPPAHGHPGGRAVFSAGDVVVYGCQASGEQHSLNYCHPSKLSALCSQARHVMIVMIVMPESSAQMRGSVAPSPEHRGANNDSETSSILCVHHLSSIFL